jgi:hypothetical protein
MTVGNHDMSHEEESDLFDVMKKVNDAGSALKFIAWAFGGMAVAGLGVAGWVWTVNQLQAEHDEEIRDMKPRVYALETRAVRYDAAPPVSREQLYEIDKRLAKNEDQLSTIKEQSAMILETLKKLESRP